MDVVSLCASINYYKVAVEKDRDSILRPLGPYGNQAYNV
jgi:hypothetical protein